MPLFTKAAKSKKNKTRLTIAAKVNMKKTQKEVQVGWL